MENSLPSIPAKRYFTIGEVGELCGVKPHVLRYWEQEFTQLRPVKRRGNRRYYQRHEVMMIRKIRGLLYDQGFTISGARNKLLELSQNERQLLRDDSFVDDEVGDDVLVSPEEDEHAAAASSVSSVRNAVLPMRLEVQDIPFMHEELLQIRALLTV